MLIIKKLSHPLPYEELSMVLKDAFKERLEAGLNFACASFNGQDLKNRLSDNAVVFGAYIDGKLVGMNVLNTIREKFGIRFGTTEYTAVVSSAKRQGIGLALSCAIIEEAKMLKLDVLFSDTAIPAVSAIKYHKKNGYKEYGHSHYAGRTYESINFILPLTFKGKVLSCWLGRKILKSKLTNR